MNLLLLFPLFGQSLPLCPGCPHLLQLYGTDGLSVSIKATSSFGFVGALFVAVLPRSLNFDGSRTHAFSKSLFICMMMSSLVVSSCLPVGLDGKTTGPDVPFVNIACASAKAYMYVSLTDNFLFDSASFSVVP